MVSLYFFVLYSGFLLPLSFLAMTSFGFSPKEVTSQEQVARDHCRFSHFGANYQPFLCHWRFPCSPTSRTCVHLGLQNLDFNLHSEWQFLFYRFYRLVWCSMHITLLVRQRKHQITSHARGEGTDRLGMTVPMKDAEAALKSLGMSEKGMEKET